MTGEDKANQDRESFFSLRASNVLTRGMALRYASVIQDGESDYLSSSLVSLIATTIRFFTPAKFERRLRETEGVSVYWRVYFRPSPGDRRHRQQSPLARIPLTNSNRLL